MSAPNDPKTLTELSRFLSFVLRHKPESIGLELDDQGWADVDALVEKASAHGRTISEAVVKTIVATSPKQRFALSEDRRWIRASQGHSIAVELGYEPKEPPELLFHGTVAASLEAIRASGLLRMGRHHVHLSPDSTTARTVGVRRGKPVILTVAALRMHRAGHAFFLSANGVWLTDSVPARYLTVLTETEA